MINKTDTNYYKAIYDLVAKIPKGKVTTYGDIAKTLNHESKITKKFTPRLVGRALHLNPDPKNIPCHRVVDRNGKLATNFAFGGIKGQRKKLESEGANFIDSTHIDLKTSKAQELLKV